MSNAAENFTDEHAGSAPEKRDLLDKLLLEVGGEFNSFPLSFAQQRLWFLDQLEPNSPLYNETVAIRLRGHLDADVLQQSFNEVVRRHESLRTVFAAVEGQPVQVVLPRLSLPLPLVDLEQVPDDEREAEVARRATVEARQPFDLTRGPLVRSTLLRLGSEEHVLLLVMHHIISDGWSGGVLFREMGALYEAFRAGRPSPLGELEIQYADYAYWQRDWLRDEVLDEQLAYWKKQLAGKLPVLELPVAAPRPVIESYGGARITFMLPTSVRDALKRLGQSEGATLFMTLLAAFKTLLHRYTTETDLLLGTPVAGRVRSETEELIGFFANTLVLRTSLAGDPTFRELLRRVREVTLEAYAHQELPFEKLVEELQPERALGRNPIFQAMFVLQNAPMPAVELPDFSMELREIESGTAKFDLLLIMDENERGLKGTFEYNTDLFNAATIERLVAHFLTLLEGVAADPDRSLSLLPLLTEAEWQRQIFEWNATGSDAPLDDCIHRLFEAQAARTPDAAALSFGNTLLTYRELNRLSNQLAHYLRRLGVGPEMIVGICMERSWEMVVALLGVVKAGGAGVALDLTYPRDRLRFMIRDAHMPVLLTQTRVAEMFKDEGDFPVMVCLDEGFDVMDAERADDLESGVTVNNLLYVIYTSGSTGLPKGIGMSHRAFLNLLRWQQQHPRLSQQSKILQFATFGFCVSFQEIFTALCSGGTLVMPSEELRKDVEGLAGFIEEQHIERLHLPFAALKHLAEASAAARGRLPSSLREVVTAGEQLQVTAAVKKLFGSLDNCSLHNQYGASETHVVCDLTLAGMSGEWPELPPIGRPIANTQIYLLNRSWQPVPVGVPGELYVGGASLARCYVNDAALTAERFIPDPFCLEPGARLYRTGDLARHLPDGRIEYLGRADLQVKIRGYRVELGEVETVLAKHDAVRDVAVVAHAEPDGSKRLTAYVVLDETHPTANELRAFLKRELPEYMVPTAFVSMSALPLNANGKLDQQALPAPTEMSGAPESYAPPRNQIEDMLAGIWSDVLRLERVGINDNFFELGGHSLLATQVMSRVRAVFGVELPLRTLFEKPVMADLAESIARAKSGQEGVRAAPILPVARASEFTPLSFSQHRIWLYSQFDPLSAVNNIPTVLRINGALDPQLLERVLNEIAGRHESLRTTFAVRGDQPVQTVAPSLPLTLTIADSGTLSPEAGDEELERVALDLSCQPFDLERGPLWRAELRRLREDEHVLFLIMHHIISDGWSIRLIVRELAALYEAFAAGRPSPLPGLPVQYADWVAWQREWLRGEVLEDQLAYWRRQLEGAPTVLELPTDHPRADAPDLRGEVQSFLLPQDFTDSLKALSRQENVTLFMTLLAAFQLLLARYSGQEDILVGTPVAGRSRAETEELVGCFINTLVLRARLSPGMTVRELLRETREMSLGAFAHQDLPFEKLLEELSPPRDLRRHPLFQFMFVLHTTAPQEEGAFAELTYRLVPAHNGTMPFDLILAVAERGEGLHVAFGYHSGLFEVATVKRMAAHFEVLLKAIVADPRQHLAALPLLSEQEQRQLNAWNQTQVDYPHTQCIQQLFERQAELTPHAVALSFDGQQLSYAELNRRANQLAHYLRRLGVGPEVPVALFVERSLEMIVGLLAVLKAGGAYVPLDIASPLTRLTHILDTLGAPVLLTQESLAGNLPSVWAQTISLDTDWELIESESGDNPPQANTPDNLAYVIYTSGSTGGPKGVSVTHRGVVRLVKGTNYVNFGDDELFLQASPIYFDASTFEIWGALLNGAQLVIAPPHHLVVEDFRRIIEQHRITTLWLTAGLFHQLAGEHIEVLKPVRQLLAGGDVLSAPHVRRALEVNSPARLVNGYGPTEGTTFTCCHVITDAAAVGLNVPIGRPIANTQVFLLDSQLRPVPVGVTGELYIGGDGLARGYFNEPALTAEKFMPHPFGAQTGERLYRSGDQARYLPDGTIEFVGRIDHQVKIRGFRVELGEIEAALGEHPAVRQCVAIAWDEADDKRLAAYAAVTRGVALSGDELRAYLKEKLPAYMVPGIVIVLDELPLTPNGKVDRRALPPPGANRHTPAGSFVAPRDAVEHRLVEIWRSLLNVETVGVFDDFFDLGGHSLLATQLIARVRDSFEVDLTFSAVFEHPRLAEMACAIKDEVMKQLEGMSEEEARESLQHSD